MVSARALLLAGLIALSPATAEDVIKDDSYFYGDSPPVDPSPQMTGEGSWQAAYEKAAAAVKGMSVEEKVNLTGGYPTDTGCSGGIPPNERMGFPGMCLSDAGNGLRNTDFVSSFPSGIHVGASWNAELAQIRGAAQGAEFRKKGVNVLLGPVVGPLGRVVESGRIWEGFSSDPYLSGVLAGMTVQGVQSEGVITSVKHFIANEQETNRQISNISAVSSNIDDRTIHELYLWPFQDAVKAGAGNIMCSYQRINNSYGCSNSKTLNGILKTELGFQGFVVSDWGAQHAGVATALAGLDMTMPDATKYWGDQLVEAVKNGSVPEERITDMATRILTTWYQFNQDELFPNPGFGMAAVLEPHDIVDARDPAALPAILQGAVEGHVLVKNEKDTLPLKKPKMLSLFGYSAKSPDAYSPSGEPIANAAWNIALEPTDPGQASVGWPDGISNSVTAGNGTMLSGGGSGATTPALFTSPFEAIKARAARDFTAVYHAFYRGNEPYVDPATDSCIVFGNAWASEGYDRPAVRDDYTDGLIKSVADQCNKTVVVFHNAGVRLVDQFVDHPNVTAVIFAHLPGQETGNALTALLYGDVSPSGKLPYTVGKNESDYGHLLEPDLPGDGRFSHFPQSNFTEEGLYIDYRAFDRDDVEPRYEFGFGLSYTTFNYTNLTITPQTEGSAGKQEFPRGAVVTGGQADLWDVLYVVTADVANAGEVDGAEVAQLYVGIANAPARQLRGFDKVVIPRGETRTVAFKLTRRDLSVWDAGAQMWKLQGGEYTVWVGASSRKLPLSGEFSI